MYTHWNSAWETSSLGCSQPNGDTNVQSLKGLDLQSDAVVIVLF